MNTQSINRKKHRAIIALEPGKRGGKPCIRGLRITIYDVLTWLADGISEAEIIEDYPELTGDLKYVKKRGICIKNDGFWLVGLNKNDVIGSKTRMFKKMPRRAP